MVKEKRPRREGSKKEGKEKKTEEGVKGKIEGQHRDYD